MRAYNNTKQQGLPLFLLLIANLFAAIAWLLIFGLKTVNFWWGMASASGLLAIWSIIYAKGDRKFFFDFRLSYIVWGIGSAAILYIVFWIGGAVSTRIFGFASSQIDSIYANKAQMNPWILGLLLLFWIGPAEEIFWRGMGQRVLSKWFGSNVGWILGALVYTMVHLWAANFILFMAALIGGLYWGWLYKRFGSLWPGIISHALWDLVVFIIVPLK
ncbi:MAG TPA: CPBP family intramembrane metalloprotease [candidate division Zixibacteria bacterium]|nr:CPBP family intramembrane metalloprotease [candidate division Zixibacteria bacterium]